MKKKAIRKQAANYGAGGGGGGGGEGPAVDEIVVVVEGAVDGVGEGDSVGVKGIAVVVVVGYTQGPRFSGVSKTIAPRLAGK